MTETPSRKACQIGTDAGVLLQVEYHYRAGSVASLRRPDQRGPAGAGAVGQKAHPPMVGNTADGAESATAWTQRHVEAHPEARPSRLSLEVCRTRF